VKRFLVVALFTLAVNAQDKPAEKPVVISGIVFGDAYQFLSSSDPELEGRNGFILRRGYLTFDKSFGESLSARLRFEVNQPGDYRTNVSMEPFVKDAFLRWKQSPRFELIAGISPTPTWDTAERIWGYRAVERTAVEVFRLGASRDFGVAAIGTLGTRYRYHVQVGNGSGTGNETNVGKKVAASFSVAPTTATLVELYADRADADRSNLGLFAAWQREGARVGLQLGRQTRGDLDLDVASLFAVYDLRPTIALIGRVDRMFDPNPEADRIAYLPMSTTSEATMFIAGADWKVHKNVSIIPNAALVTYDDGEEDELVARATLVFTF